MLLESVLGAIRKHNRVAASLLVHFLHSATLAIPHAFGLGMDTVDANRMARH